MSESNKIHIIFNKYMHLPDIYVCKLVTYFLWPNLHPRRKLLPSDPLNSDLPLVYHDLVPFVSLFPRQPPREE